MSMHENTADHLVIGGGLAGSMVAMRLASAGRPVTLLEKESAAHHKVCGEFLSREAVDYLRQAGVDPLALGAETIRCVRLSSKNRTAEAALPFTALSLSRCVLDEAMLARAAECGCEVRRGVFVENLAARDNGWSAQLRDHESLFARTTFLANGKHDLRGWDRGPSPQGDLIGFKLHWRLTPDRTDALRDWMELFLFPGGYGGLALVEGGVANLCLVVRRNQLQKLGGWTELLAAIFDDNRHMRRLLEGATPLWDRPLAISSIPYGYLAGRPSGVWCVGDQAAVIPSFTGDGMSIALHSAALAAHMLLAGKTAAAYHRRLHAQIRPAMRLATWFSRALVTRAGRTLAPFALGLYPGAMRWVAASTRIPERALLVEPATGPANATKFVVGRG
jgi:flavin-dependent dehydrogenase